MPQPRKFIRPTKERLQELYATHLDSEIAAMYGATRRTVVDWRQAYGIPGIRRQPTRRYFRRRKGCYTVNEQFFSVIDTEKKAYVLGFISADGFVSKAGKQLTISLQERDRQILSDIRDEMGSNAPLFERKSLGGFAGSGRQVALTISCRKIVSDLAAYGVIPGKSATLTYPALGPTLERHYIRGIFDGDGNFHPRAGFYFLGTEALIDGIQRAIFRHTGILLNKRPTPQTVYRLSGYKGSGAVLDWLYDGASIFLRRKHQAFMDAWRCPGRSWRDYCWGSPSSR